MRLGFGLNLEQTQKLAITPELRQAITILQLSNLELLSFIEGEMLENPLLEVSEEESQAAQGSDLQTDEPVETVSSADGNFDPDWQQYFEDGSDLGFIRTPHEADRDYSFENYVSAITTLPEYLNMQLRLALPEGPERLAGEFLIGNLDDNGYLCLEPAEAADCLGTSRELVEKALGVVQGFEPSGVGARNLQECLLLQVFLREDCPLHAERVIVYHLEDLARGRLNKISRTLNITLPQVQAIADFIKTLDPKPGRRFGAGEARYIVPDVVVEKVAGEYVVLVNDVIAPRLRINQSYQALVRGGQLTDPGVRKFLEGKLNSASWIIRSLEQRRLTMYRVVKCLVDFQREFFDRGIRFLKPLNLRQVADALGMHESTVSRTTTNKYVQTPQGVFELKFFFANGLETEAGWTTSAESIKMRIREYIEREDCHRPYTDQQVANYLATQGIHISRRTVAKYRDEMSVPSTAKRRRY